MISKLHFKFAITTLVIVNSISGIYSQDTRVPGNLDLVGDNGWRFNTPENAGRTSLFLAPITKGTNSADYSKQTEFKNNGDISVSNNLVTKGNITNGGTDFRLGINDDRDQGIKKSNRALVHLQNDELHLNFNGDFEGGTVVDSDIKIIGGTTILNASGRSLMLEKEGADSWQTFHNPNKGWYSMGLDSSNSNAFSLNTGGELTSNQFVLLSNGNIGIGKSDPKNKLSVNGTIWAKEVKVSLSDAADWVFETNYKLKSLKEVEVFIKRNKHLPEIPSADEFRANDMKVSEMSNKLLQKIEELTLYAIDQEKQLEQQKAQNLALEARLAKLEVILQK